MPIFTVPPENAVEPLPPAVKETVAGRNDATMLFVPVPASRPVATTLADRVTVPAKEPRLVKPMVATAAPPLGTDSVAGNPAIPKSKPGTVTERVDPPVTATK